MSCSFRRDLTMRSVILEIKERFDMGLYLFNVSLSRDGFFEEWGDKGLLEMHGESTCR